MKLVLVAVLATLSVSAYASSVNLPSFMVGTWSQANRMDEKDQYKVSISWDISPINFVRLYSAYKDYEGEKLNYSWEKAKEQYDLREAKYKMINAKKTFENINANLKASQTFLDSANALYENGSIEFKKRAKARSDYYENLERFYNAYFKYLEASLEYLLKSGVIREWLMESVGNAE